MAFAWSELTDDQRKESLAITVIDSISRENEKAKSELTVGFRAYCRENALLPTFPRGSRFYNWILV